MKSSPLPPTRCARQLRTSLRIPVIAEPAGALAIAGMKKYAAQNGLEGDSLLAVVSGANTNFDRLRYISERTDIGERREAIFSVTIPSSAAPSEIFVMVASAISLSSIIATAQTLVRTFLWACLCHRAPQMHRSSLVNLKQLVTQPLI